MLFLGLDPHVHQPTIQPTNNLTKEILCVRCKLIVYYPRPYLKAKYADPIPGQLERSTVGASTSRAASSFNSYRTYSNLNFLEHS